jgi:hypothetical protein
MSDEEINAAIVDIFPDHLRRSNTNLLIRPFFGVSYDMASTPEAMVFDAIPWSLEIRLARDPDSLGIVQELTRRFNTDNRSRLEEWFRSPDLPAALATLVDEILEPLDLPSGFSGDLVSFEWNAFRHLTCDGPSKELLVVRYGFELIDIDELIENITPRETFHVFDGARKQILAMNFDPRRIRSGVERATIRRMSNPGRQIIRAEHTMVVVLSRMLGREKPLAPEVLASDATLTCERVEELLGF